MDYSIDAARDVAAAVNGVAIEIDVSNEASVCNALDKTAQLLGGFDGLVNTAGIFNSALLSETEMDLWSRMITINLTGTYLLCRHAIPYLKTEKDATIVTLGSGVALVPPGPGSAAYVASKGGVIALSRSIAAEAAPHVRVNCVCPGMVDTPMTRNVLRDKKGALKPSIIANYALKRAARPEEIAKAIVFLTSSASSFVTGTTMAVDGGRTFH